MHLFSQAFFTSLFQGIQLWTQRNERKHRATNKHEIFGLFEKTVTTTWNASASAWREHTVTYTCLFSGKIGSKRLWKMTSGAGGLQQARLEWTLIRRCVANVGWLCKWLQVSGTWKRRSSLKILAAEAMCKIGIQTDDVQKSAAIWWVITQSRVSSLAMKHEVLNTNLKLNTRAISGNLWRRRSQRKQVKVKKLKTCWSRSSSTTNSCHRVRRLISSSRMRSWGVSFTQYVRRDELWLEKSLPLHYDNAPAHNTLIIWQFLGDRNIAVL